MARTPTRCAQRIKAVSGGHTVLALRFGDDPAEGAAALSEQGRQRDNSLQMADTVFPVTQAMGLGSLILALFRRWPVAAGLALVPCSPQSSTSPKISGSSSRSAPSRTRLPATLALASGAGAVKPLGSDVAQGLVVSPVRRRSGPGATACLAPRSAT